MNRALILQTLAATLLAGSFVDAAVLYQSAELGETGIPREDVGYQVVPGSNIDVSSFLGVRFELDKPAIVEQIGGHFVGPFSEADTIFGALVKLDGADDFPDSDDLSTPDVLASTLLELPLESADVYGDVNVKVDRGWYAILFGGGFRDRGLFGARGRGSALLNNSDNGDPNHLGYGSGFGWGHRDGGYMFAATGVVVPEPLTVTIGFVGWVLLSLSSREFTALVNSSSTLLRAYPRTPAELSE